MLKPADQRATDIATTRSSIRVLAALRRHHRSPTSANKPAGQDPKTRLGARNGVSTALFARERQSFLDNLIAGLAQIRSWNDPMTSSYCCLPFGLARNVQFVSELFARAI